MMKVMLFIITLLLVNATGCKNIVRGRTEIDKIMFVRLFAIDKGDNDAIKVTIVSKNVKMDGGKINLQEKSANVYSGEGDTVFTALRQILTFADKKPYYGHIEFILLGEELASEGILPYLDLISRDHEFRLNEKLYIVRGSSACDLIEKTNISDHYIADRLKGLETNDENNSLSNPVTIGEAIQTLDNPTLSLYLPYIEMAKAIKKESNDMDKFDVLLMGYAVLKDDKLLRYLTYKESRGVNWIRGSVKSAAIGVRAKDGTPISIEVINTKAKVKPKLDNNPSCTFEIGTSCNIGEIMGGDFKFVTENLKYVENQFNKEVEEEVWSTLKVIKEENLDFIGLYTNFNIKYPVRLKSANENWQQMLTKVKYDVKVQSVINRTYLIREPTGQKRGNLK